MIGKELQGLAVGLDRPIDRFFSERIVVPLDVAALAGRQSLNVLHGSPGIQLGLAGSRPRFTLSTESRESARANSGSISTACFRSSTAPLRSK
jgi:hypothetical protein